MWMEYMFVLPIGSSGYGSSNMFYHFKYPDFVSQVHVPWFSVTLTYLPSPSQRPRLGGHVVSLF